MLGFWTLHGDVGDYGLIQNLWKTEVYELALYIAKEELKDGLACTLQACIDATPTDGNGVSSSDLEQIGVPTYKEADDILWNHIHATNKFPKDHVVIQRHLRTEFKRNNPTNVDLFQYWTEGER
jgi:NH3-dependent NAD+ synthetase